MTDQPKENAEKKIFTDDGKFFFCECGAKVSVDSKSCPSCGDTKAKRKAESRAAAAAPLGAKLFVWGVIGVIVLGLSTCFFTVGDTPTPKKSVSRKAAECQICLAVRQDDLAKVKRLLDEGANPNSANNIGYTALHSAAVWGNAEMVKMLLEAGANPNAADRSGETVLDVAKIQGRSDIIRILEEAGAK